MLSFHGHMLWACLLLGGLSEKDTVWGHLHNVIHVQPGHLEPVLRYPLYLFLCSLTVSVCT